MSKTTTWPGLVALLNLAGGTVLLGVDDSGAIVGSMRAHNGTAPELIAEEHRFIVRLLKAPMTGS